MHYKSSSAALELLYVKPRYVMICTIKYGRGISTMTQHQPYDHALKSLMGDHAAEIIPQLLPDTEVIREQNVEIKRELLRADLVYLVNIQG